MWLNQQQITASAIRAYRKTLLHSTPHHLVIDGLFDAEKLKEISSLLQQQPHWQTQQHSYSALYVTPATWQKTASAQRFVQRDVWQRAAADGPDHAAGQLLQFLQFLRGAEFMALLSRIFSVQLTDRNVAKPEVNTNYFRLGPADFVNQHADDSPGREVCLLLYLTDNWQQNHGGELVFAGQNQQPVPIAPLFNRCVLFDPSSEGSEHWVNAITTDPISSDASRHYRLNVTSWYWSE